MIGAYLIRVSKRGEASLTKLIPPPFVREGDKGDGLLTDIQGVKPVE